MKDQKVHLKCKTEVKKMFKFEKYKSWGRVERRY